MPKVIDVQKRDNFAVVTIQNPPYNVLTAQVFEGLNQAFTDLKNDQTVKAVILTGGHIFSVGADIQEIWEVAKNKDKQRCLEILGKANDVANLIANLGKPTIVAIDGPCLGGGNELAMACTVRIATHQAKFGQPEINLGIMPGMGATQRLPRLIGAEKALMLMVSGANISAKDAKDHNLVSKIVDSKEIIAESIMAVKLLTNPPGFIDFISDQERLKQNSRIQDWKEDLLNAENYKRVAASRSHEAVVSIENSLRFGANNSLDKSLKEEQRLFAELLMTDSARSRIAKFLKIEPEEKPQKLEKEKVIEKIEFPKILEDIQILEVAGQEEMRELRRQVREFAQKEIKPLVKEMEEKCDVPMELVCKMAELGFFGVCYDEKYGGSNYGKTGYCIVTEELSRVHGSTALLVGAHVSLACGAINIGGTEEQKMKYLVPAIAGEKIGCFALTEPGAGSDAASVETRAEKTGSRWVINGQKRFITNGNFADFAVVIAQTDKILGEKGLAAFIVETHWPGFSAGKNEDKTGLRASHTVPLYFENLEVPEENMLGKVGEGFKIFMKTLNGGRLGLGAGCIGASKALFEEAFRYASERTQFGRTINMFQSNQFRLAQMAAKIYFMQNSVYRAAADMDAGKDVRMEAAVVKFMCSEMLSEIANATIRLFGGNGLVKDYPVERIMRDALYNPIFEGTNDIQQLLIFKELMKSGGFLRDYDF